MSPCATFTPRVHPSTTKLIDVLPTLEGFLRVESFVPLFLGHEPHGIQGTVSLKSTERVSLG